MTRNEIESYITTGSRSVVCIFREQIQSLWLMVMSFYIMGKPGAYVLSVEFDPIDMVDAGEGWVWQSVPMDLETLLSLLTKHFDKPIDDWENVTKSGRLSFYDDEIDNDVYMEQENQFKETLIFGEKLLPSGVEWAKTAN